jgi:hypothetical protein
VKVARTWLGPGLTPFQAYPLRTPWEWREQFFLKCFLSYEAHILNVSLSSHGTFCGHFFFFHESCHWVTVLHLKSLYFRSILVFIFKQYWDWTYTCLASILPLEPCLQCSESLVLQSRRTHISPEPTRALVDMWCVLGEDLYANYKARRASESCVLCLFLQVFYAWCVSGRQPVPVLTWPGEQQAVHHLQILSEGLLRLWSTVQARSLQL